MQVICNRKTQVYDEQGSLEPNRYIDKGDKCQIGELSRNLSVEITYPVAGGARSAWIKDLANFRQG